MIKNTEITKLLDVVKDESVNVAGQYGISWKILLYNTWLKKLN